MAIAMAGLELVKRFVILSLDRTGTAIRSLGKVNGFFRFRKEFPHSKTANLTDPSFHMSGKRVGDIGQAIGGYLVSAMSSWILT